MSGPTRILITGASGCVGQYTAETLLRRSDAHLLLLLRDPAKLTAIPADHPRVTLLVGDLRDLGPHAEAIASVHRVIHTATAHAAASTKVQDWRIMGGSHLQA